VGRFKGRGALTSAKVMGDSRTEVKVKDATANNAADSFRSPQKQARQANIRSG
jgi:hypothetical protein